MKAILGILAACLFVSQSVYADPGTGGSVTFGVAKAIGEGSESMDPGFNFEGNLYGKLNRIVYMGGRFGLSRWSFDMNLFGVSIDASLSYLEFAPLVKINAPITDRISFFGEPSPSFCFGIARATARYGGRTESDADSQAGFGFSVAAGFDIYNFEIKNTIKMVRIEDDSSHWLTVSAGFVF